MNEYADLCLRIPLKRREYWPSFLKMCEELGYSCVAVPHSLEEREEFLELKRAFSERGIYVASRVDLSPRSPGELLSLLNKLRLKYEVIAVSSRRKAVLRQAGKDRRVDLIALNERVGEDLFGKHQRELMSSSFKAYEIRFSDLSRWLGDEDVLRRLREELRGSLGKIPVVISSGASDPWGMRHPLLLASLLTFLTGEKNLFKAPVSLYPMTIVRRNRAKVEGEVVADGVRKVR